MRTSREPKKSKVEQSMTVVGIDVGGKRKGFHAVAIKDGKYYCMLTEMNVEKVASWCRGTVLAQVIAVDAPCRWSQDGHARPAERELMQERIWCFSTPTRNSAVGHPTKHFDWMLRGEELYHALRADFPICRGLPIDGRKCCIETFPHAITWRMRDGNADARQKRRQRRELLEQAGIDVTELTNIDLIDAALCALTAYHAAIGGECKSYGDGDTGLIIIPYGRLK